MKQIFNCFLIFLFFLGTLKSQDPLYWQLTDEDGLPGNTVYNVAQDGSGFIWLGTSNGICKYDGNAFTSYSHPEMLDNEVLTIRVDLYDRVWFNNLSGQLFYIENDSCHLFYSLELGDSLTLSSFITTDEKLVMGFYPLDVWETNKGTIYTYDLADTFDFNTARLRKPMKHFFYKIYNSAGATNHLEIFSLMDPDPTLNTSKKEVSNIYKWSVHADSLAGFEEEFSSAYRISGDKFGRVNAFFESGIPNVFYLLFHDVITCFQMHQGVHNKLWSDTIGARINNMVRYKQKTFLLTQQGLRELLGSGQVTNNVLSEYELNHGFVDNQENLWISTNRNGVLVVPGLSSKVFTRDPVTSMNNIKEGSELAISTKTSHIYLFKPSGITEQYYTGYENDISAIESFDGDTYLVGTDIELFQFDKTYPDKETILIERPFAIKALKKYQDSLFIGNYNMARLVPFEAGKPLEQVLLNSVIIPERTYAFFSTNNIVYVGTYQGLYTYFDGQSKKVKFKNGATKLGTVLKIEKDLKGRVWAIGNGTGLCRVEGDTIVEVVNDNYPGLSKNINDFAIDSKGRFWLATPEGVVLVDREVNRYFTFNKSNGLPTNGVTGIVFFDGQLFCGTEKGLIRLSEDLFEKQNNPPAIHINYAKLIGADTFLMSNPTLHYGSNFLTFNYSGLSFKAKKRVTYEYRLVGLDDNWIATNSNTLQFPGLEPGDYELQVKAVNYLGIKSLQPAKFAFTITPPWYKTWWFYLLTGMVLLGIIFTIFQIRYNNLRKREAIKLQFSEKVNQLRMEALQTQMNPHFIFNAMNAIQHYLTVSDGENAMRYLAKFARLIRLIFEQSKEKLISLEEEMELLELYLELEVLRFGERIQTELKVSDSVNDIDNDIRIPPLVIQPIVENAFRHGLFHKEGQGHLSVLFETDQNYLTCIIKDDGIGFSASKMLKKDHGVEKYRSSGIDSTKERLAIYHNLSNKEFESSGLLDIHERVGPAGEVLGTTVSIKFKLLV